MCNVIVDGIIFSFGILLPEISAEFNETKATTAWIGSLQTGLYLIVGNEEKKNEILSKLTNHNDCFCLPHISNRTTCQCISNTI